MYAGGDLVVRSSVFTGNRAAFRGGAIIGYGTTTIESSTFDDDTASDSGAAVEIRAQLTVRDSTFAHNVDGGDAEAISMASGSLISSTFVDNASAVSSFQAPALVGNIFAGGSSTRQVQWSSGDLALDGGGNLFTTSAGTEDLMLPAAPSTRFGVDRAALFATGALADNGGSTPTIALNPGGPAIRAVPSGAGPTDQRGVARPTPADAGAYQYVPPVAPVAQPQPQLQPSEAVATAPTLASTGVGALAGVAAGVAGAMLAGGLLLSGLARRQRRRTTTRS